MDNSQPEIRKTTPPPLRLVKLAEQQAQQISQMFYKRYKHLYIADYLLFLGIFVSEMAKHACPDPVIQGKIIRQLGEDLIKADTITCLMSKVGDRNV